MTWNDVDAATKENQNDKIHVSEHKPIPFGSVWIKWKHIVVRNRCENEIVLSMLQDCEGNLLRYSKVRAMLDLQTAQQLNPLADYHHFRPLCAFAHIRSEEALLYK